jgi:UDP-glucose 4-epimerase
MTRRPIPASVLVTGGLGFVGRAVVAALLAGGALVRVLDAAKPADVPRVPTTTGRVEDPAAVEAALAHRPDAVVHLAAATSVLGSVQRPGETFASNVSGTHTILEGCRRHGVRQLVLASSNAVTGAASAVPVRTDLAPDPLTPYGATKAAAEMLVHGHAHAYGLLGSVLRLSNVYGPGMAAKDSIVPRLARAAAHAEGFRVHGSGTQRRDFLHVRDAASAVCGALACRHSGTVSVGSGRTVTVLELVELMRAATGAALQVQHVPAPPGEMEAVVVDPEPAASALGFRAGVALEAGLRETVEDLATTSDPATRGDADARAAGSELDAAADG